MKFNQVISVAALGIMVFALWRGSAKPDDAKPKPQPTPDVNSFTLAPAFATNDNRAEAVKHAYCFATLCRSLAAGIEYDGKRQQPRITTGVQIDDLRRATREYALNGVSFAMKYPSLPKMVEVFLNTEVGKSGAAFDESKRAAWVKAFRELGDGAERAAKAG